MKSDLLDSHSFLFVPAALLMLFIFLVAVQAQTETGQIAGAVTDPSGAVIAGANITVISADTGAERQTATSEKGIFTVPGLLPGVYEITAQASGFAPKTLKVEVTVGARVGIEISLAISQGENSVEVLAEETGVRIETQSQQLSTIVSQTQIRELPTITRNPYNLVELSGNVSPADPSDRGVEVAINGQRAASTDILLDGADNVDYFGASLGQSVPLDSVQEISIITSNFSAEFGRASGGIVNVATKYGSNELHGTIYEFNRISALASNSFDNNARFGDPNSEGKQKGVFSRNQFGYSVGGPVIKGKLFFFSSGEFIRVRSSNTLRALAPTPQLLAESAPATQAFFNAFTLEAPISGRIVTRGDIPAAQLNPNGPFAKLPAGLPVFGEVLVRKPFGFGGGPPLNSYQFVSRFDWVISKATTFYGRYALQSIDYFPGTVSASIYKGFDTGGETFNNNILLSLTHVFSPRLTSQSKFVFSRLNGQAPLGKNPIGPGLRLGSGYSPIPGLGFEFPSYFQDPFGGTQNLAQVNEDINYTTGKHGIRFGGSYFHIQDNRTAGLQNSIEILGRNFAQAIDNFVLGQIYTFLATIDPQGKFPGDTITLPVGPPNYSRSNRYNEYALYAQDSWRAHPRVTLNLGLRYEYFGVQHNKDPRLDSNFYFGTGANIFEQIRNGKVLLARDSPVGGLWNKDLNNFAPRVGIAWDLFGNGKTSLRAGYGIGYERNFGNVTYNVAFNPPNNAGLLFVAGQDLPSIPISLSNSGPLAGTGMKKLPPAGLRHVNQNIRTAYANFWSVSLQQSLFNNIVVSIDYSGSHGVKLYSIENLNRRGSGAAYLGDPDPSARLNKQYAEINTRANNGFSIYHGLTVSVESRNLARIGLQFTARYTWSHAIDNLSSTFSEGPALNLGVLDPFNPRLDKGHADFDLRHRFVTSGIWSLPFAQRTSGIANKLLGGWGINYIFTANTGTPLTIYDCTNRFETCPRLMLVGPINVTGPDNPASVDPNQPNFFKYIDLSNQISGAGAYFNPNTRTSDFGPFPSNMTARNAFRRPGNWGLNLGVTKKVSIKDRYGLQFRAEFFNAFNHANLFVSVDSGDISVRSFIPAVRDGNREVQLALKVLF